MKAASEKKKTIMTKYHKAWANARAEKDAQVIWEKTVGKKRDAEMIAGDVQAKLRKEASD